MMLAIWLSPANQTYVKHFNVSQELDYMKMTEKMLYCLKSCLKWGVPTSPKPPCRKAANMGTAPCLTLAQDDPREILEG